MGQSTEFSPTQEDKDTYSLLDDLTISTNENANFDLETESLLSSEEAEKSYNTCENERNRLKKWLGVCMNNKRVQYIDALRGFVVLLMILVDDLGAYYPSIDHSPWHGFTLADVVMPTFLFITGCSVSLVFSRRILSFRKILLRTGKMFFLGLFLQGCDFPIPGTQANFYDLATIRISGIFQRIAICYGICSSFFYFFKRFIHKDLQRLLPWCCFVIGILIQIIYFSVIYSVKVPDCQKAGLVTPECNVPGYFDRILLGKNHLYSVPTYQRLPACSDCSPGFCLPVNASKVPEWCHLPFDPEGFTSTFSAMSTVFFGASVTLFTYPNILGYYGLGFSFSFSIIGCILILSNIPSNKNLWTAPYSFISGALAMFQLLLLSLWEKTILFLESKNQKAHLKLKTLYVLEKVAFFSFHCLVSVGRNAILVYVLGVENLVVSLSKWIYFENSTNNIASVLYKYCLLSWLDEAKSMTLLVLLKFAIWITVAVICHKRRYYIVL